MCRHVHAHVYGHVHRHAHRIVLATSDRNLQLHAMMAGIEAKPLDVRTRSGVRCIAVCTHA